LLKRVFSNEASDARVGGLGSDAVLLVRGDVWMIGSSCERGLVGLESEGAAVLWDNPSKELSGILGVDGAVLPINERVLLVVVLDRMESLKDVVLRLSHGINSARGETASPVLSDLKQSGRVIDSARTRSNPG